MVEQQRKPVGIDQTETIHLTSDIVSAFVANNAIPASELQDLLRSTFATLTHSGLASEQV
ncbi:MucR family transcriptional regulator [Parvularcula oceani]|uniref:MucR family transcriptional regulator n=1 Tax=Parvularcula oceani TaxID=1247963 RepID=UPI0004E1CCB3|nr:MucR family transcriptional regulator [Parvularcula oceani]